MRLTLTALLLLCTTLLHSQMLWEPEDFDPPSQQERPILDGIFTGYHPTGGAVISGTLAVGALGFSIGNTYSLLEKAAVNPEDPGLPTGLTISAAALIGAGVCTIMLDYFLGKRAKPAPRSSDQKELNPTILP